MIGKVLSSLVCDKKMQALWESTTDNPQVEEHTKKIDLFI